MRYKNLQLVVIVKLTLQLEWYWVPWYRVLHLCILFLKTENENVVILSKHFFLINAKIYLPSKKNHSFTIAKFVHAKHKESPSKIKLQKKIRATR